MEQLFHHPHGALVGFVNDRVVVEVFVEVIPQLEVEFAPLRAVLHQRLGVAANLVSGPDPRVENAFFGGPHDVAHLAVDDRTDDEITAAFLGQFAVLFLDCSGRLAPESHLAV